MCGHAINIRMWCCARNPFRFRFFGRNVLPHYSTSMNTTSIHCLVQEKKRTDQLFFCTPENFCRNPLTLWRLFCWASPPQLVCHFKAAFFFTVDLCVEASRRTVRPECSRARREQQRAQIKVLPRCQFLKVTHHKTASGFNLVSDKARLNWRQTHVKLAWWRAKLDLWLTERQENR